MSLFIYINGYPGIGKLTVAKELCTLLPKAKVVNNHLLIDPAAALFERTAAEYQPLRRAIRKTILESISNAESTRDVTWIFTDQQSSDETGTSAVRDYERAAAACNAPFVSVILTCGLEENLRRAQGEGRGVMAHNTKLTDLEIVRSIREGEGIFHFRDEHEFELDITTLSPSDAATKILQHIGRIRKAPADEIQGP